MINSSNCFNNILNENSIREDINFMLSHFEDQHELFPRTIMNSKNRYQMKIEFEVDERKPKDIIFDHFKKSNFIDCKINAFPFNTKYTRINFEVKNKTAADFIMIDLDLQHFKNKEKLDKQVTKISTNLSLKFNNEVHPTILWTGNGYHIYQPIDGIVFEREKIFYDFLPYLEGKDLTTEFIRFAEKFLSNDKADPKHLPSINSCLVRVPGTFNSKNGQQVRIIQKWDGQRPSIKWITSDFLGFLIDKRNKKIRERKRQREFRLKPNSSHYKGKFDARRIEWIERLLQISLKDNRKYCLFHILVPYLTNVRNVSPMETSEMLETWLLNCSKLRPLDFNPYIEIKIRLRYVNNFKPISLSKIKDTNMELYHELKLHEISV